MNLTGHSARVAGAPISWGVCEVPGWGRQLAPDRVLGEMAALGVRATELGPLGWLPLDGAATRAALDRHGLRLVGGFVPLVLHEADGARAMAAAEAAAVQLADAGAEVLNAALVADEDWGAPFALDAAGWDRVAAHLDQVRTLAATRGLEVVLHPHVGTLVETAADVERALERLDVPWCFDTGHLLIGGTDPVDFAREHAARIGHVHLKDVDAGLAARVRSGELSLVAATQLGLFRPLGAGDARIAEALDALDRYTGWLVLEQDTALPDGDEDAARQPAADVRASLDFLAAAGVPA